MWTLEQAKSDLPDVLRHVDAVGTQFIDAEHAYVVIPQADYERLTRASNRPHLRDG
jgi:hypothetical protein